MIPQSSVVHFFKEQPGSVQTCARPVFSIGWMCNDLRLARGARRRCCSRCLSMARRNVRRSVRPCLGRTEFAEPRPEGPAVYPSLKQQGDPSSSNSVCGAKRRRRRAVSPLAEAVATGPTDYPFGSTWSDQATSPFSALGTRPAGIFPQANIMAEGRGPVPAKRLLSNRWSVGAKGRARVGG
jgi:hypothetical protein